MGAGRHWAARPAFRAKGNYLPACGQTRPNIKGGFDDRAISRAAEQSSGASNHLAIQTSPKRSWAEGAVSGATAIASGRRPPRPTIERDRSTIGTVGRTRLALDQ